MDTGTDSSGTDSGIYAVNVRDGTVRTILKGADAEGHFRGHPFWSPDGSRISFGEWTGVNGPDVETHVITASGTGDRVLPIPTSGVTQAPNSWSNDGTRLLVVRGYPGGFEQSRAAIVPTDGSGTGLEIPVSGRLRHWRSL